MCVFDKRDRQTLKQTNTRKFMLVSNLTNKLSRKKRRKNRERKKNLEKKKTKQRKKEKLNEDENQERKTNR